MELLTQLFEPIQPAFWIRLSLIIGLGLILIGLAVRLVRILATRAGLGSLALSPLKWCTRWVGILILAATVGHEFGVNLYNILAAAVAMVAIGFVAVWSVMSNISCTFLLLIFKPFRIMDEVEFPGEPIKGRVVDLTLLHTTLKTPEGDYFHIPNNLFFKKRSVNVTVRERWIWRSSCVRTNRWSRKTESWGWFAGRVWVTR
ncbi:MAG: mechanosensitive ion channel [Blastochloris sp.]|nr:mechanosensitive ion channel [Blastochloris sp.]